MLGINGKISEWFYKSMWIIFIENQYWSRIRYDIVYKLYCSDIYLLTHILLFLLTYDREPFALHHGVEFKLLLKHLGRKSSLMRIKCGLVLYYRWILYVLYFFFYYLFQFGYKSFTFLKKTKKKRFKSFTLQICFNDWMFNVFTASQEGI